MSAARPSRVYGPRGLGPSPRDDLAAVSAGNLGLTLSLPKSPDSSNCSVLRPMCQRFVDMEAAEAHRVGGMRPTLDPIDLEILRTLQEDGRISNADLARTAGLSRAATHARVRRLEQMGAISRYTAIVDPEAVGFDLLCLIGVAMQLHSQENIARARAAIAEMPEVLECYHVTGDFDYILKVAVRNRSDLQRFILDRLTPVPGIARINTSLVLGIEKSTTALPMEPPAKEGGTR
jgi:Lrp/AsnC family transcriptional regulator, leucine-responsive regulatory protein